MKQKNQSLNSTFSFNDILIYFRVLRKAIVLSKIAIKHGQSVQHIMDTSFGYFGSLQVNIMELCVQWTLADRVIFFSALN